MHTLIGLNLSTYAQATLIPIALDCAAKSVLILTLAGLAVLCLRRASAAVRHLVWFLAVASLLLLPVLSCLLPGWDVLPPWMSAPSRSSYNSPTSGTAGGLAERASLQAGVDLAGTVPPSEPSRLEKSSAPPDTMPANGPFPIAPGTQAIQSSKKATNRSPWELIEWIWLAGVLAVALPTALGMLSLWRLARLAQPVRESSWIVLLSRLLACLRFRRPLRC